MGRVSRTAVIAWTIVSAAGCASIAGLDGITEQGCAPNCGGDGSTQVDATSGDALDDAQDGTLGDTLADSTPTGDSPGETGDDGSKSKDGGKHDGGDGGGGDGGCSITHNYDLDLASSSFTDCVAQGVFNITLAMDACAAYTGDATQCDKGYTFNCKGADGGDVGDMVCSNGPTAPACACWGYNGVAQAWMVVGKGVGLKNCACPVNQSHWN